MAQAVSMEASVLKRAVAREWDTGHRTVAVVVAGMLVEEASFVVLTAVLRPSSVTHGLTASMSCAQLLSARSRPLQPTLA